MINRLTENIIEIAWVDQYLLDRGHYKDVIDSLDRKETIIQLAKEFEDLPQKEPNNYYEDITDFAEEKLLMEYGRYE